MTASAEPLSVDPGEVDPLEAQKEDLVDFVLEQTVRPVDRWAVAATLESRGLRDVDAVERYAKDDIFDLANDIYARCRVRLAEQPPEEDESDDAVWYRRLVRFFRFYLRGMFFATPMVIQIVSVLFLGSGLWAFLGFSEAQATTVAVGTITSFVLTGGFVQAIGRLGLYYGEQGSHILAYQVCGRLVRLGMVVAAGAAVAWLIFNLFAPFFPQTTVLVSVIYHLLLSMLWLAMAVLYMLQLRRAIVLVPVAGIAVVMLVIWFTPLSIYLAHWLGLAFSDVLAGLYGFRVLKKRAAGVSGELELARLPRSSILVYSVGPYFAYGVAYFGFLFLDRVVGWSTGKDPLPFLIWFRTPYELGLDWALLSLVLTIALLEYTINEFSSLIIPIQKRFSAFDIDGHNRYFQRFYSRQAVLLAVITVISVVLTYRGVVWLRRFDDIKQVRDFFANPITFQVFFWGAAGYAFLVWGLMNGVFFFSLSRPWYVLRAIGPALAASGIVGFFFSRMIGYQYAVVGLVVGAIVFAAITSRYALRVLRRLDYYYYSAY